MHTNLLRLQGSQLHHKYAKLINAPDKNNYTLFPTD